MDTNLSDRLAKIWLPPDFTDFFKKYSNRAPLIIKKEKTIFFEGDQPEKLYFIEKGFVKLHHMSDDGKDTVIYLYGPGSILGVRALTSIERDLKHNAEALTDVTIRTISRSEYLKILEQNPQFLVDLLHVFIDRLNYTEKKLEGFIIANTTARVANFLYNYTNRFCLDKKEPIQFPLGLTHQDIADFVGSLRETVTGAMKKLEKEKIIAYQKKTIKILDLKKLQKLANS